MLFSKARPCIQAKISGLCGVPSVLHPMCSWAKREPFLLKSFVLSTDASFLDDWAFDRFEEFLNESRHNTTLAEQIDGDGLIVFLHLLGCDTNGHAHRPYSDIYLNNINLVDRGVKSTVKVMEEYFPDGQTSYIFTADHGMSNKGRSPSVSMQ